MTTEHPPWIITAQELKSCLDSIVLVDVREPIEFVEARIDRGKLIPLGELSLRAPDELEKDSDIVIYCAHGRRSLQAVMALKVLGFKKLRSLEGGLEAWENEGGPVIKKTV